MKPILWYSRLRKLSVKWKIFMLSAMVFGVSLTAGFAYFTYQSYWLTVTTTLNGLMNFTDAKQQGVIRFIDQNEKLAQQLAHLVVQGEERIARSQFQNILASDVFRLDEHPFKDEIIAGTRRIPTWSVYHAIDYVTDGVVRISSDPKREGMTWSKQIDVKPGYSDPWYDGEIPVLTFAAPAGKGVLYVHADARILGVIVSGEIGNLAGDMGAYYLAGVGDTFDYYLVNKENLLITESRTRPGLMMQGRGSELPWRTTLQQAGVVCGAGGVYTTNAKCTTGCREAMGFYTGATGKKMIGASMPFYDSNWTLVVEQEADELLLPLWWMFAEQFAILLLIGMLSIYVYLRLQDRLLIHPLMRLRGAIEEVEKFQDFSKTIKVGSEDEIGDLADSFNRMSHNLDSIYRHLEQRVEERTNELTVLNEKIKTAMSELELQKLALDEHAIVSITDVEGTITYANDRFCEINQYTRRELIGHKHGLINSKVHSKEFFREMYRTIAKGKVWHGEMCNRAKDGSLYWVETTIVPFMDDRGKPYQYIAIRTDITANKESQKTVQKLAYYDELTNLPNRRFLMDRLHQELANAVRHEKHGAVVFIDLDNFKYLNDTKGHMAGDLLLIEVAQRLRRNVREGDTVARLGGDEFVLLLSNLGTYHAGASAVVERITSKMLIELNQPYVLNGVEHHSSPSIGIALFCDSSHSVEELLKQADSAMYLAKKAGRNTVRFYDPQTQAALVARAELEQALRRAIENNELHLYYQIQVNEDGRAIGAEALLRWQRPESGLVLPTQFIPIAEESGLIVPIGYWVLETACAQLKRWENDPLTRQLVLAVNVSGHQFGEPDFVAETTSLLQRAGIRPDRLKLEITESILLKDVANVASSMNELKTLGVKFSLDDFGTGFSSLSYLKQLPLDQLKIDQVFIRDLVRDVGDRAIVRTIIAMANSLDMEVIAEGVETEEQRRLLVVKGCAQWQGYLFGEPLPLAEFERLLGRYGVL